MPSSSDQTGRTRTLRGGAGSSLEGRDIELSVSPKDIRTSPYDLRANRSDRRQSREGDRWFESTSLQGRVCEPSVPESPRLRSPISETREALEQRTATSGEMDPGFRVWSRKIGVMVQGCGQAVSFLKERLLRAPTQLVPVVHRRDPRDRAATATNLAARRAGGPCGPTGASVPADD
jgi:hypothetical protein